MKQDSAGDLTNEEVIANGTFSEDLGNPSPP